MAVKSMEFKHCVIQGTHYEAGRQLGEMFKDDIDFIQFMTSPFMGGSKLPKNKVTKSMEIYDRFDPGINDEIKGFADAIGADHETIVYYFAYIQPSVGSCSHMAVLPSITEDGLIYHGRNYDYGLDDKPMLFTSRIEGKYRQIGFGCQLFGRFDGMNECGLSISTSAGVIQPDIFKDEGCVFPVVVRTLLDRCKDVEEAVEVIMNMPISDYRNFIVADKRGKAALIEVASSHKAVKMIGNQDADQYICSANHYSLSDMIEHDTGRMWHSVTRYKAIEGRIKASSPNITKDTVRRILSDPVPAGACCHHYRDGMGTLWSMLFDPMNGMVDICFGSPHVNHWRAFDFSGPVGVVDYKAELPDEPAEPYFWNRVRPGGEL